MQTGLDAARATPIMRSDMPDSARLPRWFTPALVLLAAGAWLLLTRWSDFPHFYHTDEPGKVQQIAENTRNLHHPLLLLESAALAVRAIGAEGPQEIVETGRAVSAGFTALACALLAATVARRRGAWAGLVAGTLLLLQPDVQEYSRYLKEDAALLFGVCAVFAAMARMESRPTAVSAALLGAATALALSAKYIGAIMLVPAAWVLADAARGAPRRLPLVASAILACLTVAGLVNLRLLLDPDTFRESLSRETTMVLEGHAGVTKRIPHAGFLVRLVNRGAHLLPLCLIGGVAAWRGTRPGRRTEWFLIASPLVLAVILSFSAKDSGRYFLPACAGLCAAAAVGLHALAASGWRRLTVPAFAATAALSSLRAWPYLDGFRSDARRELLTWVATELPADARLVQGRKVCLPDASGRFADGYRSTTAPVARTASYVPDLAESPAALAALGFTHVVLAGDEFERYLRTDQAPKAGREEEFARRRAFYVALESEGRLVWSRPPGKVGTHQPELRLYALPAATRAP